MACPAVAIEVAPEIDSNHTVTATLDNPAYQARVAEALAAAIVQWRAEARQP
jgi:N-acetylmuramoyl-L-alanine amidase